MKTKKIWVLAAILICGTMVLTSCKSHPCIHNIQKSPRPSLGGDSYFYQGAPIAAIRHKVVRYPRV